MSEKAARRAEDEAYPKYEDLFEAKCEDGHMTGDEAAAFEAGWNSHADWLANAIAQARAEEQERLSHYAEHRMHCNKWGPGVPASAKCSCDLDKALYTTAPTEETRG